MATISNIQKMTCKVQNFMSGTYGKFMSSNIENVIVFEYQPMLNQILNNAANKEHNQDFKAWLAANPNILY